VSRAEKNRRRKEVAMDEWEELAMEERAYRKYKKGKISKRQYEAMCELSD
jgi:hypothetical protein